MPKAEIDCLHELPDFKDFDPVEEALVMLNHDVRSCTTC